MSDFEILSCEKSKHRNWYAWNNLQPPKPDDFHVTGEIQVPNPGVLAFLVRRDSDDTDHEIDLQLVLVQQPGAWPSVVSWADARYDRVFKESKFKTARIFCNDNVIETIPVADIH